MRAWSNGNAGTGQTTANLAVVPLDSHGRFCLFASSAMQRVESLAWRALASDFFYDMGSVAHVNHAQQTMTLNLAYPDGHVSSPSSKPAYGRLRGMGGGNTGWKVERVGDVIGALEYTAEGKEVKTSDFGKWPPVFQPLDPPVQK